MEKEMRELYIEGVAIHGGPEPCVDGREAVGEASVGVRAGLAIEPPGFGANQTEQSSVSATGTLCPPGRRPLTINGF